MPWMRPEGLSASYSSILAAPPQIFRANALPSNSSHESDPLSLCFNLRLRTFQLPMMKSKSVCGSCDLPSVFCRVDIGSPFVLSSPITAHTLAPDRPEQTRSKSHPQEMLMAP